MLNEVMKYELPDGSMVYITDEELNWYGIDEFGYPLDEPNEDGFIWWEINNNWVFCKTNELPDNIRNEYF